MRIAIIRLSSIGDIIQTMIVIQFIKKALPSSIIDWFVDELFKDIVQSNPDINKVYCIGLRRSKKTFNIFPTIKQLASFHKLEEYDLVIDFQGLLKSAIVSRAIKAQRRSGYSKNACRESIASFFYSEDYDIPYSENVFNRYIALVEKSLDIKINRLDIPNRSKYLFSNYKFDLAPGTIGIVVGTSRPDKIFAMEKYVEITNKLDRDFLLIWGNEVELNIAKNIKLNSKNINITIAKKYSYRELIGLISSINILVGGDTGIVHMAWACKTKSITLFGPTDTERVFAKTKENISIQSRSKELYANNNINTITCQEVINAVLEMEKR